MIWKLNRSANNITPCSKSLTHSVRSVVEIHERCCIPQRYPIIASECEVEFAIHLNQFLAWSLPNIGRMRESACDQSEMEEHPVFTRATNLTHPRIRRMLARYVYANIAVEFEDHGCQRPAGWIIKAAARHCFLGGTTESVLRLGREDRTTFVMKVNAI